MRNVPSIRRRLFAAVLAGGAVALPAGVAQAQQVGTSAAVRGDVTVTSRGAARQAAVSEAINLADRVRTLDASSLQVLLLDATTFTVAQNANLTIDRFVYDPDRSTGEVAASVAKGAFRFVSGRIGRANPRSASIRTPSATIGIRGTMLEGVVGADAIVLAQLGGLSTAGASATGASFVVLRGPGFSRNSVDRSGAVTVSSDGGSRTITRPNRYVFVPAPGAAPLGPFELTPEQQSYLDFALRTDPVGPPVDPVGIERSADAAGQTKFQGPVDVPDGAGTDVIDDSQDPPFDDDLGGDFGGDFGSAL